MNSLEDETDLSGTIGPDGVENGTSNVSRSGRVRKKNSLLAAYVGSLEEIEKPKKKGERVKRESVSTPKVTLSIGGARDRSASNSSNKAGRKAISSNKRMKMTPSRAQPPKLMIDSFGDGDLEMDLPHDFDEMPNLADDSTGYSSSDVDDRTNGHGRLSVSKLKSQAQSTYMMEKSFVNPNVRNKKLAGNIGGSGAPGKAKDIKKEKGPPRVTAYTLWAKDQREFFSKKYPHLDASSLSKKLSEIWQTIPPNQRKMWKNKADKIMRKNLNIKNSAPILPVSGKGKRRGRPRIHPLPLDSDSYGLNGSNKTIAPPTKIIRRVGNFKSSSSTKKAIPSTSGGTLKTTKKGTSAARKTTPKSVTNNGVSLSKLSPVDNTPHRKNQYIRTTSPSTSFSLSPARQLSPRKDDDAASYKVTGTAPIDVAAHFALLGESLSIIGERLMDVERQPVSGSLSVLMDSLLCAITPLVCLTQQVPELNCIPQDRLARLLGHLAYVMPGL